MKTDHIQNLLDEKKYDEALIEMNNYKEINTNIDVLLMRAALYFKMGNYSNATNDFIRVQQIDTDNLKAKAGIELCKKILYFKNLNRYADPNTHMDPWLDIQT